MALTINPVSSFYFPQVQSTSGVRTGALATAAASSTAGSAAAAVRTGSSPGVADTSATTASVLSQAFGASSFLNQATVYGTSNLTGMALLRTMFGNGASSSVFGYPSAVSAYSSFLQQLQTSYFSRYNAFGVVEGVRPPGTLISVSA